MKILFVLIALIVIIGIPTLIIKGRDDAKTFEAEIRFVLWKIRSLPLELAYYTHLQNEFERLNKMAKKDKEQIHVAWCEFARRYIQFFPELGDEATIKNVE